MYNYKPNSQVSKHFSHHHFIIIIIMNNLQVNYFSRSVPGGSQTYGQPVRSNLSPDTLLFESRFCGYNKPRLCWVY